jgi:Ran GTPase-activating protein (RanGAP) involved in mRNA processing and transport
MLRRFTNNLSSIGAPPPPAAWFRAAREGNVEQLRTIRAESRFNINEEFKGYLDFDRNFTEGTSALEYASNNNKTEAMTFLLEQGADIGSVLHGAAARNNLMAIRLILAYGADINATNAAGKTAAILARKWRATEAAQYLEDIASGRLPRPTKENWNTPIASTSGAPITSHQSTSASSSSYHSFSNIVSSTHAASPAQSRTSMTTVSPLTEEASTSASTPDSPALLAHFGTLLVDTVRSISWAIFLSKEVREVIVDIEANALTSLSLSGLAIDDTSLLAIARALRHNTALTELDLGNGLSPYKAMLSNIPHKKLISLAACLCTDEESIIHEDSRTDDRIKPTISTSSVMTEELHEAVRQNDLALVRSLLISGANANGKTSKGDTPLHTLARHGGSKDCAALLLRCGAVITAKNNRKETAEMLACDNNPELYNYLIVLQYQISNKYFGERASDVGNFKISMAHGGWGSSLGPELRSALHQLSEWFEDPRSESELYLAVKRGDTATIQLLLEHGDPSVNANSREERDSFLTNLATTLGWKQNTISNVGARALADALQHNETLTELNLQRYEHRVDPEILATIKQRLATNKAQASTSSLASGPTDTLAIPQSRQPKPTPSSKPVAIPSSSPKPPATPTSVSTTVPSKPLQIAATTTSAAPPLKVTTSAPNPPVSTPAIIQPSKLDEKPWASAPSSSSTLANTSAPKSSIASRSQPSISLATKPSLVSLSPLNAKVRKAIADLQANTLTTLDLKWSKIGDADAQALAKALEHNNTLTTLNLGGNQIDNTGTLALANALEHNHTLTRLDLSGNQIDNTGTLALAEALRENKTLIELNLADNQISNTGARALTKAFEHNKTLTYLDLGSNKISDIGIQVLAEALEHNKILTYLGLGCNQISDIGIQVLAEALEHNKILTYLGLGCNQINASGAQALANALKRNKTLITLNLGFSHIGDASVLTFANALEHNKTLTKLNLEWNQIGDTGAKALAKVLEHNKTLTSLVLYGNQIGASGAQAIAKALERNSTLSTLFLSNNQIGVVGAQALAKTLERNNTLTCLRLSSNQIDASGAQAIAKALGCNNTLRSLNLGANQIGNTGAQAIASALKHNDTLTRLDWYDNKIGDAGAQAIAKALEHNNTLTKLDLSRNQIGNTGAQAIANALEHNNTLTKLDLSRNQIGNTGAQAIANALKHNKTLTWLKLTGNDIDPAILATIKERLAANKARATQMPKPPAPASKPLQSMPAQSAALSTTPTIIQPLKPGAKPGTSNPSSSTMGANTPPVVSSPKPPVVTAAPNPIAPLKPQTLGSVAPAPLKVQTPPTVATPPVALTPKPQLKPTLPASTAQVATQATAGDWDNLSDDVIAIPSSSPATPIAGPSSSSSPVQASSSTTYVPWSADQLTAAELTLLRTKLSQEIVTKPELEQACKAVETYHSKRHRWYERLQSTDNSAQAQYAFSVRFEQALGQVMAACFLISSGYINLDRKTQQQKIADFVKLGLDCLGFVGFLAKAGNITIDIFDQIHNFLPLAKLVRETVNSTVIETLAEHPILPDSLSAVVAKMTRFLTGAGQLRAVKVGNHASLYDIEAHVFRITQLVTTTYWTQIQALSIEATAKLADIAAGMIIYAIKEGVDGQGILTRISEDEQILLTLAMGERAQDTRLTLAPATPSATTPATSTTAPVTTITSRELLQKSGIEAEAIQTPSPGEQPYAGGQWTLVGVTPAKQALLGYRKMSLAHATYIREQTQARAKPTQVWQAVPVLALPQSLPPEPEPSTSWLSLPSLPAFPSRLKPMPQAPISPVDLAKMDRRNEKAKERLTIQQELAETKLRATEQARLAQELREQTKQLEERLARTEREGQAQTAKLTDELARAEQARQAQAAKLTDKLARAEQERQAQALKHQQDLQKLATEHVQATQKTKERLKRIERLLPDDSSIEVSGGSDAQLFARKTQLNPGQISFSPQLEPMILEHDSRLLLMEQVVHGLTGGSETPASTPLPIRSRSQVAPTPAHGQPSSEPTPNPAHGQPTLFGSPNSPTLFESTDSDDSDTEREKLFNPDYWPSENPSFT